MMKNKNNFDQIANRYLDYSRKWDRQLVQKKYPGTPDNFIPLWIADMDFKAPPKVRLVLKELAQNGAYGYSYAFNEFYNAIVNWHKRKHNINVEQDWIINTYGTVSTIHYVYQAFTQPNDKILMNTPIYSPFGYAAINNGLRVIENPLIIKDNRYFIDFDLLEHQIKSTQPKIYMFCSPHNPSGRVWNSEELNDVAYLCHKYNVLLVSDEVHSEMIFTDKFVGSLSLKQNYLNNLIMLTSPNKAFNLGGLKTSYSIIPNNYLRQVFEHRLKMNSITSPNIFGAKALTTAYNECEEWLDDVTKYIYSNYQFMLDNLELIQPDWKTMPLESSYLPWIDISSTGKNSQTVVTELAVNHGIVLEPGTNYLNHGEDFIRVNLGTSKSIFSEALGRIKGY